MQKATPKHPVGLNLLTVFWWKTVKLSQLRNESARGTKDSKELVTNRWSRSPEAEPGFGDLGKERWSCTISGFNNSTYLERAEQDFCVFSAFVAAQ